jgi:DNA-binding transcriptional LysR family regulator
MIMADTKHNIVWHYFLAASQHCNMTTAADELNISQPALTQAIARMEQMLEVQLFDRSTRPMTLTPYGEVVRDHAQTVDRSTSDMQKQLGAMRTGTGGRLRFGCGPDWVNEILPVAISRLNRIAPDVHFDMRVSLNDDLHALLDKREIDFFFSAISDAFIGPAYSTEILLRDTMVVVARNGHPLCRQDLVSMDDTVSAQWVLTGVGTYGRQALTRLFHDNQVVLPTPTVETNSVRAMVNIVRESDMLGFMSTTHRNGYPDIQQVPINTAMPPRVIGVTWRRDKPLLPTARQLVDECRQVALVLDGS